MHARLAVKLAPWMLALVLSVAGWLVGRHAADLAGANNREGEFEDAVIRVGQDDGADSPREERASERGRLLRAQWPEAISECISEPSSTRRLERFYELTQGLELRDFPAFMELLRNEKDLGLRGELFEVWAERDLKKARAWFDAQPAKERSPFGTRLVAVWGRADVSALASWISTLPADERKALAPINDLTWRELAATAAERNPEATLDLLATIPEAESSCHSIAMDALVRRHPAAAAARTLAMPTGGAKSSAFYSLVDGWLKTNPAAGLAWIAQLEDPALAASARTIAGYAQAKASAAEFDAALALAPAEQHKWMLGSRASWLAQSAPEEAIALARGQSDLATRGSVMEHVVREISSKYPTLAAELWLAETAQSGGAPGDLRDLVPALAEKQGVAAALRFLERIPADQAAALKDVPESLAKAAGWPAVADAATQMPAGARRTEWLQQSVKALTRDGELSAAQQLTARLPAGPDRETAVRAMGSALFSENPDTGATTLLRLADGHAALGEELQRWIKADAPEARRWISRTAMLDEDAKAELLATAPADPR